MALVRQHMQYCISLGAPMYKRNTDIYQRAQQMATTILQGLEHMKYHESPKKLGRFSLEKRKDLREDLITAFNYLIGGL